MVSSAWSKAVDGLLDNVDTYPGMSSDWADEGSSLGEAQVSTAAQKDVTRLRRLWHLLEHYCVCSDMARLSAQVSIALCL